MNYIDNKGLSWTRSEDLLKITCENGMVVFGNPEMTNEHLVSFADVQPQTIKTDAERIAELETQLAELISKINS